MGVRKRTAGGFPDASPVRSIGHWDKVTNLKLRFTHDQAYPHQWRPIDQITGQDYGNTYAIISEKPLGALYVAKTDPGTSETMRHRYQ